MSNEWDNLFREAIGEELPKIKIKSDKAVQQGISNRDPMLRAKRGSSLRKTLAKPENKAKMAERQLLAQNDAKVNKQRSDAIRKANENPESTERRRLALLEVHSRPEVKKAKSDKMKAYRKRNFLDRTSKDELKRFKKALKYLTTTTDSVRSVALKFELNYMRLRDFNLGLNLDYLA